MVELGEEKAPPAPTRKAEPPKKKEVVTPTHVTREITTVDLQKIVIPILKLKEGEIKLPIDKELVYLAALIIRDDPDPNNARENLQRIVDEANDVLENNRLIKYLEDERKLLQQILNEAEAFGIRPQKLSPKKATATAAAPTEIQVQITTAYTPTRGLRVRNLSLFLKNNQGIRPVTINIMLSIREYNFHLLQIPKNLLDQLKKLRDDAKENLYRKFDAAFKVVWNESGDLETNIDNVWILGNLARQLSDLSPEEFEANKPRDIPSLPSLEQIKSISEVIKGNLDSESIPIRELWEIETGKIPKDMRVDLLDVIRAKPTPTQQLDAAIRDLAKVSNPADGKSRLENIQHLARGWLKDDRHHLFEFQGLQQPVKNLLRRVETDLFILSAKTNPVEPDPLVESLKLFEETIRKSEWKATGIDKMKENVFKIISASHKDPKLTVDPVNTFIELREIAQERRGNGLMSRIGNFFRSLKREKMVDELYEKLAKTELTNESIGEFKNFIGALNTRVTLEKKHTQKPETGPGPQPPTHSV